MLAIQVVLMNCRIPLSIGGDDITEFLYVLLDKINFPYKEVNLARAYDWSVMEDLKERICTLQEVFIHFLITPAVLLNTSIRLMSL